MTYPMVLVCSMLRNVEGPLPGMGGGVADYWSQFENQYPADRLRFCWLEGDSSDNTFEKLSDIARRDDRVTLFKEDTGRPQYGSVNAPERMAHLSAIGRQLVGCVRYCLEKEPEIEYVFYMESDLLLVHTTMLKLLVDLNKDMVAPLIFQGHGHQFYDTWGFVGSNGENFWPVAPYSPDLLGSTDPVVRSVGSCFLATREVWENCTFADNNALRGFCKDVNEKGFAIHAFSGTKVIHPENHWQHQRRPLP